METPKNRDERLAKIQEMIIQFTLGNYSARESVSEKGDDLDAIIAALNTLGEEIQASGIIVTNYKERINRLLDVLIRYTAMDFTEKAEISEAGDELDAIAVGLNTLAEELIAARKAEEEQFNQLKESEERFRILVEGVRDYAIFRLDPQGRVMTWNKGAERIKGYNAEDIIGKNFSVFYTEEQLKKKEPEYDLKMARENGTYRTSGLRKRKDGTLFYADLLFTALRDAQGKLVGYSKVTRDITELKKNEEEIKDAFEQVETIISDAPSAVIVTEEDGKIIRWNDRAELIFGWKAEEVKGKLLHELIFHGEEAEKNRKEIRRFLNTGESAIMNKTIEISAVKKNQDNFPVEMSISAARSKGGFIFISFINDISERKKAEDEIKSTRDFLDTILENIPNMIFVKDAKDLRFIRFNKAGERLLGYTRNELIGKNDYDFFPKEEADFFSAKDHEVLRKKEIADIPEEPLTTPSGEVWLHTKKIPILDEHGQPLYMLGISEDITQRKLNEEKINRLNRDLLNNVSKLETANKELESFSYSVSHDLRAPLRAIHGYTSILLEEHAQYLNEEGKIMMASIQSNAKKMGQLIDDLLAFSRLGRKDLQLHSVDMKKLAESIVPEVLNSYPSAHPKVIIKDLPEAQADASLISQVFTNLISNAVKYSARVPNPVVEIGCNDRGKFLEYYIKDNGIGFNMQYYDKLFGVFQRLHDSSEFEGTGVGLAIVKRIINKHGGKVWAESEQGKGSTFYFSLRKEEKLTEPDDKI